MDDHESFHRYLSKTIYPLQFAGSIDDIILLSRVGSLIGLALPYRNPTPDNSQQVPEKMMTALSYCNQYRMANV